MKKLIFSLFLMFCPVCIYGQSTTVSMTIIDTSGTVWSNGTVLYNFVGNGSFGGQYQWNGANLPDSYKVQNNVQLDGTGFATFSLPSSSAIVPTGSSWLFNVCPNSSAPCQQFQVPVNGTTLNLSSTLAVTPPSVSITTIPTAYSDANIKTVPSQGGVYFNTGSVTPGLRYFYQGTFYPIGGGSSDTCSGCVQQNPGPGVSQQIAQQSGTFVCLGGISVAGVCNATAVFSGGTIQQIPQSAVSQNTFFDSYFYGSNMSLYPYPGSSGPPANLGSPALNFFASIYQTSGQNRFSQFSLENVAQSADTDADSELILYFIPSGTETHPILDLSGKSFAAATPTYNISTILGENSQILNSSGTPTNPCLADGSGGGSCNNGSPPTVTTIINDVNCVSGMTGCTIPTNSPTIARTCNSNGCYRVETDGTIEEWGVSTPCGGTSCTLTFPYPFTTTINLSVTAAIVNPNDNIVTVVDAISITGFTIHNAGVIKVGGSGNSYSGGSPNNWQAKGN